MLAFYNDRRTAEQHIKEGEYALKWTRLSCMKFAANAVRLQLHALAYNLANFLRTLATPKDIETWSLTSLRERVIKTGARLVRHGRCAVFQMAAAAPPQEVFAGILDLINALRGPHVAAVSARLAAIPDPQIASPALGQRHPPTAETGSKSVGAAVSTALRARHTPSQNEPRQIVPGRSLQVLVT